MPPDLWRQSGKIKIGKSKQMCYNGFEVSFMDELQQDPLPEEEETGYTPRPRWQVWAARIGLVLFLLVITMYYINLFRGGL